MVRMSTREEKWRRKGSHSSPEEEKKKHFLVCNAFLAPLGVLFIMKTLEDVVITAYKLAVFENILY